MNNKYKEAMDKVAVTDEMKKRIIDHVCKSDIRHKYMLKDMTGSRYLILAAACIFLVIIGSAAYKKMSVNKEPVLTGDAATWNVEECKDTEELSKKAGFDVREVNRLPFKAEDRSYLWYSDGIAEINYFENERSDGTQSLSYRKAKYSGDMDNISGDYNEYGTVKKSALPLRM